MPPQKKKTGKKKECPFCKGTGVIAEECMNCMGFRCLECDGQGYVVRDCESCQGTGKASKPVSNPGFQQKHGHYCHVCGRQRANEKFSSKGHATHICMDCAAEQRGRNRMLRKLQDLGYSKKEALAITEENVNVPNGINMRLWTLHPQYLDRQGLLAVWREGLLAKRVLEHWTADPKKPTGYRNHPQLDRFKATADPVAAISRYLAEILTESQRRNYHFDSDKTAVPDVSITIPVTTGQVEHERKHLLKKLSIRDPEAAERLKATSDLQIHPMFVVVPGEVENWEKRT